MEDAHHFSCSESGLDQPNLDEGFLVEKIHLGEADMVLVNWAKLPKGETKIQPLSCLFFGSLVIHAGKLKQLLASA